MIVCSKTKSIYYPTSGKRSLIYGTSRVRYVRAALVVRPKD